jgi:E3 ubiquitin-protein ligase DOA10
MAGGGFYRGRFNQGQLKMTFAQFLISISGSVASRVMLSLGIGIVSYKALDTLAATVKNNVTQSYTSIDPVVLAILNLAGGGEMLGILLSALVTRASLVAIKRFRIT